MIDDRALFKASLSERVVSFRADLARAVGGINEALFLQQIIYWSDRSADGWVYRTQPQIEEETTLSDYQQKAVRNRLVKLGVLIEERRGTHGKLHYLVDWSRLRTVYAGHVGAGEPTPSSSESPEPEPQVPERSFPETRNDDSEFLGKTTPSSSESLYRKKESTQERQKETPASPAAAEDQRLVQPWDLYAAMCLVKGADPKALTGPALGRQLATAKRLVASGATVADVTALSRRLLADPFHQRRGFDLIAVESAYAAWTLEGRPAVANEQPIGYPPPSTGNVPPGKKPWIERRPPPL